MISYTVADYYTGLTASFPLTDERCTRTLNEFGPWHWTGDFDASLSLADSIVNARVRILLETIGTGETMIRNGSKVFGEGITLADSRRATFRQALMDALAYTELLSKGSAIGFAETVKAADAGNRKPTKVSKEGITAADKAAKTFSHVLAEMAAYSDALWNSYQAVHKESVSAADKERNSASVKYAESVEVIDRKIRSMAIMLMDALGYEDALAKTEEALYREAVKAGDRIWQNQNLSLKESLSAADPMAYKAVWERAWKENIRHYEKSTRRPTQIFKADIEVSEFRWRESGKAFFEAIEPMDVLYPKTRWKRTFTESASVSERDYKLYEASYYETAKVLDSWVGGPNGVLYDIALSEGPMTLDEFKDTASVPSGYSPFVDFRVGDYEYKDAIYRFAVQIQEISVNLLLYDLVVHVDIPDTEDRGLADVAAEVTRVHFNKHYYNPPEVVCTVVSGTTSGGISIPVVLSTDKSDDAGRYFEVQLQNTDGVLVSGKVAWTARGY